MGEAEHRQDEQNHWKFIVLIAEAFFWVAWLRSLAGQGSFADPEKRSWTTEMCNGSWYTVVIADIFQDYSALFEHMRSRSLHDKYGVDMSMISAAPSEVAEGIFAHAHKFQEAIATFGSVLYVPSLQITSLCI